MSGIAIRSGIMDVFQGGTVERMERVEQLKRIVSS